MGEPYENLKLKLFRPGENRRLHSILVTTFNLDWHLETFAAELCLFDRQLMIVFDMGNGHWRIIVQQVLMDTYIYPLVILVKYSASDYYSWSQILSLLFLKADVVAQLLISNITVELLKSYIVLKFLKSEIVVELFPKSAVVVKFLKLNTWFDMKLSLSKQSRTASSSIFHFTFRVVLMQRQLTLPKTV